MENTDGGPSSSPGVNADVHPADNQMNERPPSARSHREDRIKILKERQNVERLKKLEELKQHAVQAARVREEQDSRRRKHFEEFGKKEDERRRQAEERRRLLDEERKQSLQSKWETKKMAFVRPTDRKPTFAFGSCTPRLIDNHVDGTLWKSQYNINAPREPGTKSTSAHDLHSQPRLMSASMYEWNQQRTTFNRDSPVYNRHNRRSYCRATELEPDRVFCGRRKTDLTPTLPIRREDYSSRSASRAGTSTGARSGNITPSSMTTSMMTSSIHSQVSSVPMRPRTLGARKSRPASVHVTGVSTDLLSPRTEKSGPKAYSKAEKPKQVEIPTANGTSPGKSSGTLTRKKVETKAEGKKAEVKVESAKKPAEKGAFDTSTVRRAKPSDKKKAGSVEKVAAIETVKPEVVEVKPKAENPEVKVEAVEAEVKPEAEIKVEAEVMPLAATEPIEAPVTLEVAAEPEASSLLSLATPEPEASSLLSVATPEPEFVSMIEIKDEGLQNAETAASPEPDLFGNPFGNPFEGEADSSIVEHTVEQNTIVVSSPAAPSPDPFELDDKLSREQSVTPGATLNGEADGKPKLMTEEEAKAALAEKRRLAREAQEREAAKLEEEARLEEERQRLEAEEADRLALEARQAEEERLRRAIEEQERKELEEQRKREEDEVLRLERENYEREAAKEAERIRLEMEERLKREEEERLERKRRVEAIMSRTRKSGPEKATTPVPEEVPTNEVKSSVTNGTHLQNPLDQSSPATSINNLNNYNNNNDFSNTLIDFDDLRSTPTATTQSNNSSNMINNSLQDLLS